MIAGTAQNAPEPLRRAYALLEDVTDPEIPVLSVIDLGIIRRVELDADGALTIGVSPTYSGCAALAAIRADIAAALETGGFTTVRVEDVLSPAWSSDWISARGRERLAAYGIAPPQRSSKAGSHRQSHSAPACPRCGSEETELLSEFGSTPCKALHRCRTCREPFDRFKCI